MTAIIAYATPEFAFLAADSARWDFVQKRNLGPVRKLHRASETAAFAIGGQNVDRTRLASQLVDGHKAGEALPAAARRFAPPLFAELRRTNPGLSQPDQFVISWYASVGDSGCQIHRHRMPEDWLEPVRGFDCMSRSSRWLWDQGNDLLPKCAHHGRVALDLFAYRLIATAAERDPNYVGFPAIALIIRRGAPAPIEIELSPAAWRGPRSEFSVDLW